MEKLARSLEGKGISGTLFSSFCHTLCIFFLTAFCFLVVELFLFVDDKTGSADENSESHSRARLVRVIQDQSVICLLFYASAILNNANSIICFIK